MPASHRTKQPYIHAHRNYEHQYASEQPSVTGHFVHLVLLFDSERITATNRPLLVCFNCFTCFNCFQSSGGRVVTGL